MSPKDNGGKLSTLSNARKSPQWSFGNAPRWKHEANESQVSGDSQTRVLSQSLPSLKFSVAAGEVSGGYLQSDLSSTLKGPDEAGPRLDGSLDRFLEPGPRPALPAGKSYNPAQTLGEAASPGYRRAPAFSMGGSVPSQKAVADPLGGTLTMEIEAELEQVSHQLSPQVGTRQRRRATSFGSAPRLKSRVDRLPNSPGPGAYEVPRALDPAAAWSPNNLQPWGRRTSGRSPCENPTATDTGPGEGLSLASSSNGRAPTFGHRLRAATKDNFPDPARYTLPSMGAGKAFSIGASERKTIDVQGVPLGPGEYHLRLQIITAHAPHAVFGSSERPHMGDDVDPDEPPGPGAHRVRRDHKATDKPSTAWPQDEKLKTVAGMGPVGHPPVGRYNPGRILQSKSRSIGLPVGRPLKPTPGPTDYNPVEGSVRETAPEWGVLQRTSPRQSPFLNSHASEASAAAILQRAVVAASASGEGALEAVVVMPASKSPKWSMGARRPIPEWGKLDAPIGNSHSSFG